MKTQAVDAYVEIIRPDGSTERHRIEGEHTTVGCSSAAGIAVSGVDELEPEHLLVAPRPDGVWVQTANGARLKATVRGREFDHGLLAWGTEVDIGNMKLKFTNDDWRYGVKTQAVDAYVEVTRSDGSTERHRIEGEHTTVGCSSAAGITVSGWEIVALWHRLREGQPIEVRVLRHGSEKETLWMSAAAWDELRPALAAAGARIEERM